MENQELIFRNYNGGFKDCIKSTELKELLKNESEILLTSFFESNESLSIWKYKDEFWLKVEFWPVTCHKNFPQKKINELINILKLDTISII